MASSELLLDNDGVEPNRDSCGKGVDDVEKRKVILWNSGVLIRKGSNLRGMCVFSLEG